MSSIENVAARSLQSALGAHHARHGKQDSGGDFASHLNAASPRQSGGATQSAAAALGGDLTSLGQHLLALLGSAVGAGADGASAAAAGRQTAQR